MGDIAVFLAMLGGFAAGFALAWRVARGATGLLRGAGRALRMCAGVAVALAWGALVWAYGPTPEALELMALVCVLAHLSQVDLDRRVIPNADLALACAIRLTYLVLGTVLGWPGMRLGYYLASAAGVLAVLLATVLLADRLLGTDSMGGGDLKLFAVCALYVGWLQSLAVVFAACVLGLASSVVLARGEAAEGYPERTFPFGPSIALACVLCLVLGKAFCLFGSVS